jgi:hypothetical protein
VLGTGTGEDSRRFQECMAQQQIGAGSINATLPFFFSVLSNGLTSLVLPETVHKQRQARASPRIQNSEFERSPNFVFIRVVGFLCNQNDATR